MGDSTVIAGSLIPGQLSWQLGGVSIKGPVAHPVTAPQGLQRAYLKV